LDRASYVGYADNPDCHVLAHRSVRLSSWLKPPPPNIKRDYPSSLSPATRDQFPARRHSAAVIRCGARDEGIPIACRRLLAPLIRHGDFIGIPGSGPPLHEDVLALNATPLCARHFCRNMAADQPLFCRRSGQTAFL
jgi:hypothetical protein